jgi:hypothetical protein
MDTEWMITHFRAKKLLPDLDEAALKASLKLAEEVFV